MIRGAGKTMQAMVVFLISFCVYRVAWSWILMPIHHDLGLLMLVYPTSWVVGVVMILLYVWKGNWLPKKNT